ncbi:MAG: ATP-dependent DNA ligase [Antricoccus sp.]
MLFADVAHTADGVSATRSKLAKVALLADLLNLMERSEVAPAVGMLLGKPRGGRTGVGWRTLAASTAVAVDEPLLTIGDVQQVFVELAAAVGSGAGSNAVRSTLLRSLLSRATAAEQLLVKRILMGEIRTGALEGVLLDAVAAASGVTKGAIRRAAMLTGDIGRTAELALEGADLEQLKLTPGIPILPMLAATASSPTEALTVTGPASVEHKLDGARIQVHRAAGEVTAYTRSLANITARVPEIVELVGQFPGGDLILDGETLSLSEDGKARPFAETMSRFSSQESRAQRLDVWFFDILHTDGQDLIDSPLESRRAALANIVGAHLMPGTITSDPEIAEHVYRDATAAGHEGVMCKQLDAPYAAGRRGKAWIKIKPVHTYDLVVLGAEWGYGRRTGSLSNLHLGARDPEGLFGEPGEFVMVGKTFKGLTDELLRWQTEYFPTIATKQDSQVVMVEPTTVVEIAIDGVQMSTRYPGGVALRFARVKGYRPDKNPVEADTIDALRSRLAPPAG